MEEAIAALLAADASDVPRHVQTLTVLCQRRGDHSAFFGSLKLATGVCDRLVVLLNGQRASAKEKTAALVLLSLLALDPVPQHRDVLLDAFRALDEPFERILIDKVEGKTRFGTALGQFHELMLVILARLMDYKLESRDLLEMVSQDVPLALSLVVAVLKVQAYEDELFVCMVKLLHGFSKPDCYFTVRSASVDVATRERAVHEFSDRIDALCATTMSLCIIDAAVRCVALRLLRGGGSGGRLAPSPSPLLHEGLFAFLGFLTNMYAFGQSAATSFRQHLVAATPLLPTLLLPYCAVCLPAAAAADESAEAEAAGRLCRALRVMVLAAFRMTRQRDSLRVANSITPQLLQERPFLHRHPTVFALLLMLLVNLDALSPAVSDVPGLPPACAPDALMQLVIGVCASLPARSLSLVLRALEHTGALPLERDVRTFDVVWSLLRAGGEPHASLDVEQQAPFQRLQHAADDDEGKCGHPAAEREVAERGWGGAAADVVAEPAVEVVDDAAARAPGQEGGSAAEEDARAKPPPPPSDVTVERELARITSEYRADRAQLLDAMEAEGARQQARLQRQLQARRNSLSSAKARQHSSGALDAAGPTAPSPAPASTATAAAAAATVGDADARAEGKASSADGERFRLLGDLPALGPVRDSSASAVRAAPADDEDDDDGRVDTLRRPAMTKRPSRRPGGGSRVDAAGRARKAAKAAADVDGGRWGGAVSGLRGGSDSHMAADRPAERVGDEGGVDGDEEPHAGPLEFLCAVNRHVMKNPCRGVPGGPVFERETLLLWLSKNGGLCPITRVPLDAANIIQDRELCLRISQWHISKAMAQQQAAAATAHVGGELSREEDLLYEF